jgi:deoxyribonuclease-2
MSLACRIAALAATCVLIGATSASATHCLDEAGKPIDYFYSFKDPHNWNYHYMSESTKLKKGDGPMSRSESAVSRTLDLLYSNAKGLTYAFWNDELPDGKKIGPPHAHAKGILAFDGTHGFLLTHSIPVFPQAPKHGQTSKASYDDSKTPTYGQSFLCITIDKEAFTALNKQLLIDGVVVYASQDGAKTEDKAFAQWAMDPHYTQSASTPVSHAATITSAGGQKFTHFAKSGKFGKDLYADLVAPTVKKDLITETWQNGPGNLPLSCNGKYKVENSVSLEWPGDDEFTEHQDHSKWAVSEDGEVYCVGDINRQHGQLGRGGGTICIESKLIASQIRKVIKKYESCSKTVHV